MTASTLLAKAHAWADGDCDEETRAQARALIAAGDESALLEHFGASLSFGTAGLRAVVGPGPNRMNRAVIRRTTKAVAEYLLQTQPDARSLPVILAYDGRLSSAGFAEEAAGVLVAAGIPVRYFEEATATPLAAYALRRYSGTAAIVITASHNPAKYNGYKLYAPNGAQIISPADAKIAELIEEMPAAKEIKCVAGVLGGTGALFEPVSQSVTDAYFVAIDGLRPRDGLNRELKIVYTAMHGVGYKPVKRAFLAAGFTQLIPVDEQVEPDGHFPTAKFPNPEEAGALDLALKKAASCDAELILANDPDVDRLAVCVKAGVTERDSESPYKKLTGNQIGLLLADYLLANYRGERRALVAQSIVSSPMLGAIADKYGALCAQTLTGFKWVWNAALALREQHNAHFVFGFEEALGYSAEDIVRDKDGISAALLFAELAASEQAQGNSVLDRLARMYREHGLWVSYQHSITKEGSAGLAQIQSAIETIASKPPNEVCGLPVLSVRDFRTGEEERPPWLENTPLLDFDLGTNGRVLVRPSGTEPKLKIYVDLRQDLTAQANVWVAERAALAEAKKIAEELADRAGL